MTRATVALFGYLVGPFLFAGCNPVKGTQGMDVSRAQFTNGTTRHAPAWDDALGTLEQCAQKYVDDLPAPADSLGGSPFLAERINAPIDSLVSGGIWIYDRLTDDTAAHVDQAHNSVDGVYQRGTHRLYLREHAYRLRDEVQHELGHALSDYYPALRNPPGASATAAGDDHRGAFFRACVVQCTLCGY